MMRLIAFFVVTLIMSCKSTPLPDNILAQAQMQAVMLDMVKADEFVNTYVLVDTAKIRKAEHLKMYEQVFLIHKTNKETFYRSLKYYQQHPALHKTLYDSLLSVATRQRDSLMVPKPTTPAKK